MRSLVLPATLAIIGLSNLGLLPARAAPFAIDPDPRSPTLGELVDRERPEPVPPAPEARRVIRQPVMPREAVTVIVPGGRLRHQRGVTVR